MTHVQLVFQSDLTATTEGGGTCIFVFDLCSFDNFCIFTTVTALISCQTATGNVAPFTFLRTYKYGGKKDETMSVTFFSLSVFVATLRTCFYFSGGFEGGGKVLVFVFFCMKIVGLEFFSFLFRNTSYSLVLTPA